MLVYQRDIITGNSWKRLGWSMLVPSPWPFRGMHWICSFRVHGVRGLLQGSYPCLCGNIIFLDGNTVTHSPTISPSISATFSNHLEVPIVMGVPPNGCFIKEKLIKMDDLGKPPHFRKPPFDPPFWVSKHALRQIRKFPHLQRGARIRLILDSLGACGKITASGI